MIDTKKRWWLWTWKRCEGGIGRVVQDCENNDDDVTNTEVRLAPVDAVVCEKGSREWATVLAMRGKWMTHPKVEPAGATMMDWEIVRYCRAHAYDTGWAEAPAPWVPQKGDEVVWYRGKHHGTGTYLHPYRSGAKSMEGMEGHHVSIAEVSDFWVERVERCEEARDGK